MISLATLFTTTCNIGKHAEEPQDPVNEAEILQLNQHHDSESNGMSSGEFYIKSREQVLIGPGWTTLGLQLLASVPNLDHHLLILSNCLPTLLFLPYVLQEFLSTRLSIHEAILSNRLKNNQ